MYFPTVFVFFEMAPLGGFSENPGFKVKYCKLFYLLLGQSI